MDSRLVRARSLRMTATVLAALATVGLAVTVVLNWSAVRAEGGGMTDAGVYPGLAASVLMAASLALGARSARAVGSRGTVGPAAMAFLATACAGVAAWAIYIEPAMWNTFQGVQCTDQHPVAGLRFMVAGVAHPGPCGYQIPQSDFSSFYMPAVVAAGAAVLAFAAAVLFVIASTPRAPHQSAPAAQSPS